MDLPIAILPSERYKKAMITNVMEDLYGCSSKEDFYMKALLEGDKENYPTPSTKQEFYYVSAITGNLDIMPTPAVTDREKYWRAICTGLKDDVPENPHRLDIFDYYLATNSAIREWLEVSGTKITIPNSRQGYTKELSVRGRTLQNVINSQVNKSVTLKNIPGSAQGRVFSVGTSDLFKLNTVYTVVFDITKINLDGLVSIQLQTEHRLIEKSLGSYTTTGRYKVVIASNSSDLNYGHNRVAIKGIGSQWEQTSSTTREIVLDNIYILEGDYTNIDVPLYADGIESTGSKEGNKVSIQSSCKNICNANFEFGVYLATGEKDLNSNNGYQRLDKPINVKPNTTYTISGIMSSGNLRFYTTIGQNFIKEIYTFSTFTTPPNCYFITVHSRLDERNKNPQIEEGTVATEYQQYQPPVLVEWQLAEPLRSLPNAKYKEIASTLIQEDNPNLVYTGTWQNETNSNYNGGTGKYSGSASAKVTFTFVGTGIKYRGLKRPNLGIVNLTIDGKSEDVDCYGASTTSTSQILWEISNLENKEHTISLETTNRKNPLSTGVIVIMDAFEITTETTQGVDFIDSTGVESCLVDKYILNGGINEFWSINPSSNTERTVCHWSNTVLANNSTNNNEWICDKLPVYSWNQVTSTGGVKGNFISYATSSIQIGILNSQLISADVAGVKDWLSKNNVTILYPLKTPVTKQLEKKNAPTYEKGMVLECINNCAGDIIAIVPIGD